MQSIVGTRLSFLRILTSLVAFQLNCVKMRVQFSLTRITSGILRFIPNVELLSYIMRSQNDP